MTIPIKPQNATYTDQQWSAIHLNQHNLLLSASAGSGKTRVLVERIINQVKSGRKLSELLVVTFTELAAKEMKERIEKSLKDEINRELDTQKRLHLQREVQALPQANISTIDAFCRQVINRYYYLIDLDPKFRLVTDETEWLLFYEKVWKKLKEDLLDSESDIYSQYHDDFIILSNNYSDGRQASDDKLSQLIFDLYNKARSHANPIGWLQDSLKYYQADKTYSQSNFYRQELVPYLSQLLENRYIKAFTAYEESIPNQGLEGDERGEGIQKLIAGIQEQKQFFIHLKDLLENKDYQAAYKHFNNRPKFAFINYKVKAKSPAMDQKKALRSAYSQLLKDLQLNAKINQTDLYKFLAFDEETTNKMLEKSYDLASAIVHLCQLFIDRMQAKMLEEKQLDFQAIELYTYQILSPTDPDKNEALLYYQSRFKEVMVDEYQDVNGLQEAIIQAVSQEDRSHNRFMVGDVKQSIYRFRYADPKLFMDKYQRYANFDDQTPPFEEPSYRINLAENFRSRPEILSFVNFVFSQLMDEKIGGVDYLSEGQLSVGATWYPDLEGYETEVLLVEENEDYRQSLDSNQELSRTELQAEVIAQKITSLMQKGFKIYDKDAISEDKMRPLRYSDIVILGSNRTFYQGLENIFSQYDIPIMQDKKQNYFQRTEIMTMVELLKLIDNPYQDIPLAAVLRSPIIGLTEPEMAQIRMAEREGTYFEAVQSYIESHQNEKDNDLFNKLQQLLDWLQFWRSFTKEHSIAQLIWQIYQDTGYLDYVSGMTNGLQRESNLHGLYKRAYDFEENQFKGLFQFIRFIEKMQEREKDLESPQTIDLNQNAVQLMTVHASKGLEFPVVFYFNMAKGFNVDDLKNELLINDQIGIGVKVKDRFNGISYSNPIRLLAEHYERLELSAEEQRKLYVALTRAEQKLYLVGATEDQDKTFDQWIKWADLSQKNQVIDESLRAISSQSDNIQKWIGTTIVRHPDFRNKSHYDQAAQSSYQSVTTDFHIHVVNEEELLTQTAFQNIQLAPEKVSVKEEDPQTEIISSPLDYDYPYREASQTSSYQSVSELKRLFEEPEDERQVQWSYSKSQSEAVQGLRFTPSHYPAPEFIQSQAEHSPSEHGSAIHLLLQAIDLKVMPSFDSLVASYKGLVDKGLLEESSLSDADLQQLLAFFETTMGKRIIHPKSQVYREQPFSYLLPYRQLKSSTGLAPNDKVLIHGIIDGFLIDENNQVWLFDYKTDHIGYLPAKEQRQVLLKRYRVQMSLYKKALTSILERPVDYAVLIALDSLETFPVE
ncbi:MULTISPECIES: helicase-exonuclease AddAB subunit AddA [Aerococcus]|uniref:helicase-exonuclease AddAB subunit AddA n=1 Tax=Aerococcus TaxID=1375 RepID=UPI0007E13A7B|nr:MULTISPECIES: helicase-exonuclease AddAB subunit AddA [Aerococcus]MCY3027568.1 helicase-exonuclease AddAB subunit AddA [Aerococcus loyolae]MDK6231295.1 helicase-exonuclease AddAB subunit AddA [Aerococcus urinae]MDK6258266.1 helicase-exonuclease AddAB subunit AddA [Aerococcus urinae]MDK6294163.1 helicase-exonuclease AddAB subunit AddA [Aerococcus urinae]MDK6627959.1 helicase-exonuclease AddAB subunit AddA [Aerococcus urinae]